MGKGNVWAKKQVGEIKTSRDTCVKANSTRDTNMSRMERITVRTKSWGGKSRGGSQTLGASKLKKKESDHVGHQKIIEKFRKEKTGGLKEDNLQKGGHDRHVNIVHRRKHDG